MRVLFETVEPFLIARVICTSMDSGNVRLFKKSVTEAVGERRCVLIVDLSKVEEIDSAGLGALVAVLKWVRCFGGTLRVCGLREPVRAAVELTMLHRIFPLHATVEDAIKTEDALTAGTSV